MGTHMGTLRARMHVTTTSHNAYEWSRAAELGESYEPIAFGKSAYVIFLLRCAWSHAYGRSGGYLCSLGSSRHRTGPCGCRTGF